jgi:hypothetical protein
VAHVLVEDPQVPNVIGQMDISCSQVVFMDTSQDVQSSPGGVVRWAASQSTNPALQALMKEAERDKRCECHARRVRTRRLD